MDAFFNWLFPKPDPPQPRPRPQPQPQPRPPPSPKVFPKEWRPTKWDDSKEQLLAGIKAYSPNSDTVTHLRVMVYGPVGAGKSSFINSVNSILQGRMAAEALVDSTGGKSFTLAYRTHQIWKGRTTYPFVFSDIMGLESKINHGALADDLILALKGHVEDGYKFNPVSRLSEEDLGYRTHPTSNDKVHCLVCVIPTDKIAVMDKDIVTKMRDIRLAASEMGIPQIAVLTRIDKACPLVGEDIKKTYLSKYIKKKMEEFSFKLGIPMNCIFPISNYHEQVDLDTHMDVLILRALKQIIDFGDDFIKTM